MGYIDEIAFPQINQKGKQEENIKAVEEIIHNIQHPARNISGTTSVMSHFLHKPVGKEQLATKLNQIIDNNKVAPYALYPTLKPNTNTNSINYGMEPIHTCIRTYIGQEMKRMLVS